MLVHWFNYATSLIGEMYQWTIQWINFFELVVNCHIIAAGMHFFGLNTMADQPRYNSFPMHQKWTESQWKVLSTAVGKMIHRCHCSMLSGTTTPSFHLSAQNWWSRSFITIHMLLELAQSTRTMPISLLKLPQNTAILKQQISQVLNIESYHRTCAHLWRTLMLPNQFVKMCQMVYWLCMQCS